MRIVFYLLTVLIVSKSTGQNAVFNWAKQFSAPFGYFTTGFKMTTDPAGNLYITGVFNGTVDVDPGPSSYYLNAQNGWNAYLCKLDANGNFLFGQNISAGTSSIISDAITVDNNGDVIVGGYFNGTGDFDPGVGLSSLSSNGNLDIFISKFNSSGQLIWNKQVGGTGVEVLNSLTTNSANDICFGGSFTDSVDFDPGSGSFIIISQGSSDAFVCKFNSTGAFSWVRKFKGFGQQEVTKVVVDGGNDICFYGFFDTSIDFSSGVSLTSFGSDDIFIGKLNNSGNLLFAKQIGGSGLDLPKGLTLDFSDNIVLTGDFQSTDIDFDPGPQTFTLSSFLGLNSAFVCKLDNQGTLIWAKQFVGSADVNSDEVQVDSVNNIYSLGRFSGGFCDFDPSVKLFQLTAYYDLYLSKLDSAGKFVFAKQIGGNGQIYPYDLHIHHGSIYAVGDFYGGMDFDPEFSAYSMSAPYLDAFILKLSSCQTPALMNLTPFSHLNLCDQQSTSLNVSGNGTIWWSPATLVSSVTAGSSIFFTPPLTVGNYAYYAQTSSTCPSLPLLITVTVNAIPTVSIIGTDHLCLGSTATLSSIGASTYTWNGSLITSSIVVSPSDTTIYWVKGVDSNLCSDIDSLVLNINPLPILSINSSDSVLCAGESATISVTGALNYYWTNNEQNSQIVVSPPSTSSYTVVGYDVQGCSSQTTIIQTVDQCLGFRPYAKAVDFEFYPNPVKDLLYLKMNGLNGNLTVEIYSSTGSLLATEVVNNKTSLPMEDYPSGVYFIRLSKLGQASLKKSFIKQ